ncbi:transposase [Alkalicoccus halolimnae]|uniref:Transposase n=1 Tax=Alkalicoccus halolimnae TaxID=1667239 RepID=A0A5C7F9H2_9BACI|nr:transposase [Alkalicoccus halolimnae]TXF86210.1 transposase [Alkalicoccus halolimnae]
MVDLRTHHPIDLFAGRTEEETKAWLIKHPTNQTVSRDGSRAYARAIRETSAQIIQVTDRWHILKGLFEAVKEEIYLHFPTKPVGPPITLRTPPPSSKRKSESVREENEAKRWKVIQQVQERQQRGESIMGLSRAFQLSRETIYHCLTIQHPPSHQRGSPYDSYRPQIHDLIQQGKKADDIEKICRQFGYTGSRSTLNTMIAKERQHFSPPKPFIKPRKVFKQLWSMSDPTEPMGEIEEAWKTQWPPIQDLCTFLIGFRQMFIETDASLFNSYLRCEAYTAFPAVQRFIRGLEKDKQGIHNAVLLPWSNGVAEGHVHRLKVQKAMMYGRGSFDLLRKRILYRSSFS